ncbi:hypothetical protein D3C76_1495660 [compost metagenome]
MVSSTAIPVSSPNRSEALPPLEFITVINTISAVILQLANSRPFLGMPFLSSSPYTFGKLPSLAARTPA